MTHHVLRTHRFTLLFALPALCLLLLTACTGTRFNYQPSHAQTYPAMTNNRGVVIVPGENLRIESTNPRWSRQVEAIVADALADELKHNRVFQRVKISGSMPKSSKPVNGYSHIVTFRVATLDYHEEANGLESLGRTVLRGHGSEGPWIARSIPSKYVAEASIVFEVYDATPKLIKSLPGRPTNTFQRQRSLLFTKSYTETETVRANGYEDEGKQIHATSVALERVITRFTSDLVNHN